MIIKKTVFRRFFIGIGLSYFLRNYDAGESYAGYRGYRNNGSVGCAGVGRLIAAGGILIAALYFGSERNEALTLIGRVETE